MTEPVLQPIHAPRPSRRRASAFHQAQRAVWLRRRVVRVGAVAIVLALLVGGLTAGAGAAGVGSIPSAAALVSQPQASDTLLYDRTGTVLLADLHPPGYQHYEVPYTATGRYLPAATVAIEDANFWSEPGVDPFSIARAGLTDVEARRVVEGGSTITQQLVKRRLVGSGQSFSRKFREAALAIRISNELSKQQVLDLYLSSIAYGNTAYGAAAAARIYFHEDVSQLDLAQAAMLAGLPQDPTLLDPLTHWQAAKDRQAQVLKAMVRVHDITQEEADAALVEDLSAPDHLFTPQSVDLAPGFVDWVSSELADRFGKDAVTQGGLKVVTTLDWNVQQLAQRSVTDGVNANHGRNDTDGALVSIDPRTGQVIAMVGSAGPDVPGGAYNMAVWPPRNPGSSFKMFTYTAAIAGRRYPMVTPITDAPVSVRAPGAATYTPKNYDLTYHGTCQLQVCLGNSLNVPAVEVELGTGVPAVVTEARQLGAAPYQKHGSKYTSDDADTSFGPSLTLGGYGETPLQMATGAAVLADGGVLHDPEGVLRVVTAADGRQRYAAAGAGHQEIDPGAAFIVSQMLSDSGNRTEIFGANTPLALPGRHAAAKTGTTDNFTDAWTVGYTPSLATAVWMGNTDFHQMTTGSDGMFVAAPTWHQFMDGALGQLQKGDEWYRAPADVTTTWAGGRQAYFLSGTSPLTPAPALPTWVSVGGRAGGFGGFGGSGGPGPGQTGPTGAGCRSWTVGAATYWACAPGSSGLPGDPGGG